MPQRCLTIVRGIKPMTSLLMATSKLQTFLVSHFFAVVLFGFVVSCGFFFLFIFFYFLTTLSNNTVLIAAVKKVKAASKPDLGRFF